MLLPKTPTGSTDGRTRLKKLMKSKTKQNQNKETKDEIRRQKTPPRPQKG